MVYPKCFLLLTTAHGMSTKDFLNVIAFAPRIEYVCKKHAFFALEQPQSSLLWYYRPLEAVVN